MIDANELSLFFSSLLGNSPGPLDDQDGTEQGVPVGVLAGSLLSVFGMAEPRMSLPYT